MLFMTTSVAASLLVFSAASAIPVDRYPLPEFEDICKESKGRHGLHWRVIDQPSLDEPTDEMTGGIKFVNIQRLAPADKPIRVHERSFQDAELGVALFTRSFDIDDHVLDLAPRAKTGIWNAVKNVFTSKKKDKKEEKAEEESEVKHFDGPRPNSFRTWPDVFISNKWGPHGGQTFSALGQSSTEGQSHTERLSRRSDRQAEPMHEPRSFDFDENDLGLERRQNGAVGHHDGEHGPKHGHEHDHAHSYSADGGAPHHQHQDRERRRSFDEDYELIFSRQAESVSPNEDPTCTQLPMPTPVAPHHKSHDANQRLYGRRGPRQSQTQSQLGNSNSPSGYQGSYWQEARRRSLDDLE
ncbi:hypothetical protein CALCODRAFT_483065 [Calocera cornea HHB12733]|uniref:Uncharacterized protein n=1 Tax=Calocera cornea HHB12733 TaxID=1353952 RepID=A0A165G567_9BASI|nr:hypothetical protein CALCODRAFT_483065 [Calocera cornea HHB12733]